MGFYLLAPLPSLLGIKAVASHTIRQYSVFIYEAMIMPMARILLTLLLFITLIDISLMKARMLSAAARGRI